MLTLSGCRTRITNNDEVSNVMYDEEGWMQEDYDMRRDDLGLSKAPKPLFTGFGAPDSEEYDESDYGDDEEMLEDYEPEEEYEDPEESETKPNGSASGSGTTRPGTNRTVQRRVPSRTTQTTTTIQVVLDAGTNGGKISGKDTLTVTVKKGGTYSSLKDPDARDGYTFKGWYTSKSGGTKVTKTSKVSVSQKHRLYAQWDAKKETEPKEEEKKSYDITFDKTPPEGAEEVEFSGDEKITVLEGGTYPSLPTIKCTGFSFKGWFDTGGKEIKSGATVKITESQTLTAQWDKNPQEYWDTKLADAVDPMKDEDKYKYAISGDSDGHKFLEKSGMAKESSEDADYLIYFGSKEDAEKAENPRNLPILVIPSNALDNSVKESLITAYRIKVFTTIYGDGVDGIVLDKAAGELEADKEKLDKIVITNTVITPEGGGTEDGSEG